MDATAPGFLIAMPSLRDHNFADSVILMLEHTTDGAVGLVINRPFPGDIAVVSQGLGISWPKRTLGDIRYGGPVRTQAGCIVHPPNVMFADSQLLTRGIAVSTSRDALDALVANVECPFRLMLGYAGWGPGQLEREMKEGSWLLAPAADKVIFEGPVNGMYDKVLATLGVRREELAMATTAIQ